MFFPSVLVSFSLVLECQLPRFIANLLNFNWLSLYLTPIAFSWLWRFTFRLHRSSTLNPFHIFITACYTLTPGSNWFNIQITLINKILQTFFNIKSDLFVALWSFWSLWVGSIMLLNLNRRSSLRVFGVVDMERGHITYEGGEVCGTYIGSW